MALTEVTIKNIPLQYVSVVESLARLILNDEAPRKRNLMASCIRALDESDESKIESWMKSHPMVSEGGLIRELPRITIERDALCDVLYLGKKDNLTRMSDEQYIDY